MTVICDVTLKLPTFYIGSSSVERVNNGYHGSVSSIRFKKTFRKFLKTNPNDISTHILSYHKTRKDAFKAELELHQKYDVVKHESFVNLSEAKPNGYYGASGEKHPFFGCTHSDKAKKKMSEALTGEKHPFFGKTHTDEAKQKMSEANFGKTHTDEAKQKMSEANFGKTHTDEAKQKISKAIYGKKQKRVICEHCGKDVAVNIYTRYHSDKCKHKST